MDLSNYCVECDMAKPCLCREKTKICCYHAEARIVLDELGFPVGVKCSRCDTK